MDSIYHVPSSIQRLNRMQYRPLGQSDIEVSLLCLGSMTWGRQNSEEEAFAQLDYAVDTGINFIDTAEMYPIPMAAETFGRTEEILGNWLQRRGRRDDIILASKVLPAGANIDYVRGGNNRLDSNNITTAVETSLQRLKTDYIDLYQTHWPERGTNFFGKLGFPAGGGPDGVPIEETLAALDELVTAGKVRSVGVSNETPWGVFEHLRVAERHARPRIASIQNPYNLLNRTFEIGLSEFALRESVGLLAYSPLAFGTLSGKYLQPRAPAEARLQLFPQFKRYQTRRGMAATREYCRLADKHGLDPARMALAFVNTRPFLTSNIIGATSMQQLQSNIESLDLELSAELLQELEAIHAANPDPCP